MTFRTLLLATAAMSLGGLPAAVHGESIAECKEYFRTGKYEDCLLATTEAIESRSYGEEWPLLKAKCELATGSYEQAVETIAAGLKRYAWSVRLLMLQHRSALLTGRAELAEASLTEIERLVQTASWRYTDADDLVALGQAALALGADPRDVLEGFFDRARRNFKTRPDGFVAAGRLAVEKGDFQLAAEILLPAAEQFDDNPELLLACSKAVRSTDAELATEFLQRVLEINPVDAEALQLIVERQIDQEDYSGATETISRMLQVNASSPEGHALQAVIHHLRNNDEAAASSATRAMQHSGPSAPINNLIGTILSRRYRFQQGAQYQRAALEADPSYVPARIQLAQDLLRLGKEAEGWQLADEAQAADGYNTTVFNLLQLKGSLDQFTTLESEHFRLRMQAREAAVYGQRALALLEDAWQVQSQRYGYTPETPVTVEIYHRADDFAVRTFGIPDVAGFLGVCFGKLVTVNSPASRRENPSNWESVLWHEFCHVITLQMTDNKIPRWLSEGISVYEERQRDSRWGQQMNPEFRDRILAGNVTPVSQLSSAFLTAGSGEDLNFAYYESSMVVEFIVERFGLSAITGVLQELKAGLTINDALQRHTMEIAGLDAEFTEFLLGQANQWAPGASFEDMAALARLDTETLRELVTSSPGNYNAGMLLASRLIAEEQLPEAEEQLRRLVQLVPEQQSDGSPRTLLAAIHRRQQRFEDERKVLTEHVARNADALDAFVRLQEMAAETESWADVIRHGDSVQAIDPFRVDCITRVAEAAEITEDIFAAESALVSLLALQPDDAARFHYRLAVLLKTTRTAAARRHTLLALESAPRYRAAHRLLLELQQIRDAAAQDDAVSVEEKPDADAAASEDPAAERLE
jgi:Flp pilus assembly protein TadD